MKTFFISPATVRASSKRCEIGISAVTVSVALPQCRHRELLLPRAHQSHTAPRLCRDSPSSEGFVTVMELPAAQRTAGCTQRSSDAWGSQDCPSRHVVLFLPQG